MIHCGSFPPHRMDAPDWHNGQPNVSHVRLSLRWSLTLSQYQKWEGSKVRTITHCWCQMELSYTCSRHDTRLSAPDMQSSWYCHTCSVQCLSRPASL